MIRDRGEDMKTGAIVGLSLAALSAVAIGAVSTPRPPPVEHRFARATVVSDPGARVEPAPIPPMRPCRHPDEGDLERLRASSDAVVLGTIERLPEVLLEEEAVLTKFELAVESYVETRVASTAATLTIIEPGGVPEPLLPPGRYLLFLAETTTRDVRGPTFTVAEGMAGIFAVDTDSVVSRSCPNYERPHERIAATGPGANPTLASFERSVVDSIRPARASSGLEASK